MPKKIQEMISDKQNESKRQLVTFRPESKQWEQFKSLARSNNMSASKMLEWLIEWFIDESKK